MSKTKIKKFKNGAVLIYRKRNGSNHTAVNIGFNAGSKDNKKNGVAHFLEHMFFNGTENLTKKEIDEKNQKLCALDAYTSSNAIMVRFKKSNKVIDKAFEFASEILLNSKLSKDYLDKEKGVITEEARIRNQKAKHDIYYQHFKIASSKHYNYDKSLGTEKDINSTTIKDLTSFKDKYFIAENFVASIVGRISFGKAKKLLKQYIFPQLKSNPEFKTLDRSFDYDKPEALQVCKNDEDKLTMVLSLRYNETLDQTRKDYNTKVISSHLNNNKNSMFVRLREAGLVYSAYGERNTADNTCLFNFYSCSSKDKINDILKIISECVHDIKNGAIQQEDIDTYIKNVKYARDERSPKNYLAVCEDYAFEYTYHHSLFLPKTKEYDKWMANVNEETIKQSAEKIFNKENTMYVTFMGNVDKKELPSLKDIKKILDL